MRILFIYLMLWCSLVTWADGTRRNTINSQGLTQQDKEAIEDAYKKTGIKPFTPIQNNSLDYIHEGYTKSPHQKKAEAEGKDDYWGKSRYDKEYMSYSQWADPSFIEEVGQQLKKENNVITIIIITVFVSLMLAWLVLNRKPEEKKDKGAYTRKHDNVKSIILDAEEGYPSAQFSLGMCYHDGTGVTQNDEEAMKWLRKSAEQGYIDAILYIANTYHKGSLGVKQDYDEAIKWYKKGAEQGNALCQEKLGMMYYNGDGVEKDEAEGLKWLKMSAKDEAEGLKWLKMSAENEEP